ncbi:MAG: HEAT repeat domain-containing protein [Cyclobacteriaceae bacterium]
MEERKMEDLIIDYVDGNLTGELKDHVEKTIENKEEWKREFDRLTKVLELMDTTVELKPDASLKLDFDEMLEQEIDALDDSKVVAMQPTSNKWFMRIAASVALLILGGTIGVLVMNNMENQRELAALRNEMELTKQLVISSLQNQQSASSRLNGVNTSMVMQVSDDEIIAALVNTMNTDENTNVRLAAVSALAQFSEEDQVRNALLAALETQEDPVVMINLINLMVQLREQRAVESLKNLMQRDEVHKAVKDEAQLGLFELT